MPKPASLPLNTPDPRLFEVFSVVAQTGSATRAAEQLSTAQPNVTRSIAELERVCGFKLFERSRLGMTLTTEGASLLTTVKRNFAGLLAIKKAIGEIKTGGDGALRVMSILILSEGALGAVLGRFIAAHPGVAVKSDNDRIDVILRAIEDGSIDFGAIIGDAPARSGLATRLMGMQTMSMLVRSSHPLAGETRVHFRDLDGLPFVLQFAPHFSRASVDELMITFGVRPSIIHEAMSQRGVAQIVQHSDTIGFVDEALFSGDVPAGLSLVRLQPTISWKIHMVYDPDRQRSFVFDNFLRWLDANRIGID